MSELLPVDFEDLRQMAEITLDNHLDYFAGRLIKAAEHGRHYTIYDRTFTVAVGGAALFNRSSLKVTARSALDRHDGLEIVEQWQPEIAHRTETDWNDALDTAWSKVAYDPEALVPADRSVFGHIELLDALRRGTAHYRSVKIS